jgi:hypothetical protein
MTREEIIKEAMDCVQIGRFSCFEGTDNEMVAILKCFADSDAKYVNYHDVRLYLDEKNEKFYFERLFNQWEPKPTPWYQKPFTCRSLL